MVDERYVSNSRKKSQIVGLAFLYEKPLLNTFGNLQNSLMMDSSCYLKKILNMLQIERKSQVLLPVLCLQKSRTTLTVNKHPKDCASNSSKISNPRFLLFTIARLYYMCCKLETEIIQSWALVCIVFDI